jgi:hypothetical protein
VALFAYALNHVGLHTEAAESLRYILTWQDPQGLFISRSQEYDGFGQTLWSFGDHVRRTKSRPFAEAVFPAVSRAMDWLAAHQRADTSGLMPFVTELTDNEVVTGHLTGDVFWAINGVDAAVDMARFLGRTNEARRWSGQGARLREALNRALGPAVARTGGYIPPSLDVAGGQDWGNYWSSYPERILAPDDPRVTATLNHARSEFREGIATYRDTSLLHAYLGYRVFQTELLRNEQLKVVRGLYDSLTHTTATHAGFESNVAPFGLRSVDDGTSPHGWFSAEYLSLLRNMLVREEGNRSIYIMSAVSPAWLRGDQTIAVRNAPTKRGRISYSLATTEEGATLTWRGQLDPGTRVLWPVPEGARSVSSDALSQDRKFLVLRGNAGELEVRWRLTGPAPTFQRHADALMRAYAVRGGSQAPAHRSSAAPAVGSDATG